MNEIPPEHNRSPIDFADEARRLVTLWAACCVSPIIYLSAAWVIKRYFMKETGFLPLGESAWSSAIILLGIVLILLQGLHVFIKRRFRVLLAAQHSQLEILLQVLTRRTLILIFISEAAVFSGFCLFLLQGEIAPVFGAGVVAMLLYAQSHPRSDIPTLT